VSALYRVEVLNKFFHFQTKEFQKHKECTTKIFRIDAEEEKLRSSYLSRKLSNKKKISAKGVESCVILTVF